MKARLLIIIGAVLIIASTFVLNYYIDEKIKAQKFSDEQIDIIFKRCDYQKMMNDRNWIGLDGNKITDHQPLYVWNNSTHHLDNNTCKWQTIKKYESDANLKDALARCWTGNSEFLDDDFVLWNNETHYIDTDTCLIAEATHHEPKLRSPKEISIENIRETILTDTSYEQWRQTIQSEVDEKNLGYFSEIMLTDMKDELEQGEKISFSLVNFGYRDWCLMPAISVYHEDHTLPIYEYEIVHSCPAPMKNPTPRISIFYEQDFKTFPSCQFEGRYTIWGESFGFGPQAIGSFYCNSPEKFKAPETFEVTIPQGSSDSNTRNNFAPFEVELAYGDYIKIINQDDSIHQVILFIDEQEGSADFVIRIDPGGSITEPLYRLGTFDLVSWDENENKHSWMHGVVTVTEK